MTAPGTGAVDVRAVEPGDSASVLSVIEQAFDGGAPGSGSGVAALWSDVRAGEHLLGELVAVVEDEVVGHVGLSHCWIDARRALVDACVLSPLSTLPAHQGRGLGTALLTAAVEAARDVGRPALFLEGSPAFYGARGFVPGADHGFEAPSRRVPAPAFQVVPFAVEEWMAGRVVYPEVWWRHDATGLRDPDLGEVEQMLGLT